MSDDYPPPDDGDVRGGATDRQRDRAERVERIVKDFETRLDDRSYPVSSEELAEAYADRPVDLPNETESIGDVFDRLDEEYDSPAEAREALYGALAGEAAGTEEYDRERSMDGFEDGADRP